MRRFEIAVAARYQPYDVAVKYHLVRFLAEKHSGPFELALSYSSADQYMARWGTEFVLSYLPRAGIGPKRSEKLHQAVKQALACVRHDCMR